MKKKFVAIILLVATLSSFPISAAVSTLEPVTTDTVATAREVLQADQLYLSYFFTHIPNFEVFAEKMQAVMIYVELKKYEEAAEESDKLILELIEMEKQYKDDYAELERSLSDSMVQTLDVFKYYCDLGFAQCADALSELNNYMNGKRTYKSQSKLKTNLDNFNICYNNVYIIDNYLDDAFRSASAAFYSSHIIDAVTANDVFINYSKKFTANDWYNKYLDHIEVHSSEYNFDDIIKAKHQAIVNNSTDSTATASNTDTTSSTTETYNQQEETQRPAQDETMIVYWVGNGEVYHKSSSCPTLSRSKNIQSGTISQSDKDRLCKVCG